MHWKSIFLQLAALLPLSVSVNLTLFGISDKGTQSHDLVLNLITKFDNRFQIVVHVDDFAATRVDSFFHYTYYKTHKSPKSYTLYLHGPSSGILTRPIGLKCLNVVIFTTPSMFANYLRVPGNIKVSDVVIFIITYHEVTKLSEDYWKIPFLDTAGNVLIVNQLEKIIKIYDICFYCGARTGKLHLLQVSETEEILIPVKYLLPRTFKNFYGHLMQIAYIDYFPFSFCLRPIKQRFGEVSCKRIYGTEVKLVQLLSARLNFTYQFIQAPNRSYGDLFSNLISGKYDFAIGGLSITAERLKILQFSSVLRFENIIFMFVYKLPLMDRISAFLNPFTAQVWMIFLICTTLITTVASVAVICRYKHKKSVILRISQVFLSMLLEQSLRLRYRTWQNKAPGYFLISSWLIFCILFNTMYKSKLSSFIIHPVTRQINSLEDLLDDGYGIVVDQSSNMEIFSEKEKDVIRNSRSVVQMKNLCQTVDYVKHHRALVLGEFSRIFLHSTFCWYSNQSNSMLMKMNAKPVGLSAHGWPFRFESPFADSIDHQLNLIQEVGMQLAWSRKIIHINHLYVVSKRVVEKEHQILSFLSHFVLYGVLMAFSAVVLLLELVTHHFFR